MISHREDRLKKTKQSKIEKNDKKFKILEEKRTNKKEDKGDPMYTKLVTGINK